MQFNLPLQTPMFKKILLRQKSKSGGIENLNAATFNNSMINRVQGD